MSDAPAPASGATADLTVALAAELAKHTGTSWVRWAGRSHAVWHAWAEGGLCLLSGGAEQRLPDVDDLVDGAPVEVVMRSADHGGRLLTWAGSASVVRPGDARWEPVTAALLTARLNLPDLPGAVDRWARDSVVRHVVPA